MCFGSILRRAILEVLANGSMRVQCATLSGRRTPCHRRISSQGAAVGGDPTGAATGPLREALQVHARAGPLMECVGRDAREYSRAICPGLRALLAQQLAAAEVEMGLRFSLCRTSAWRNRRCRRLVFVGSQNGHRLCAGCDQSGVHSLVLQCRWRSGTAISVGGPCRRCRGLFRRYRCEGLRTGCDLRSIAGGRPRSRIIRWPGSRDPLRFIATGCMYRMSSYEESQGCAARVRVVARSSAACRSLNAPTGTVIWRTYMIPGKPKPRGESSMESRCTVRGRRAYLSAPTIDVQRGFVLGGNWEYVRGCSCALQ